jgi:RNA polymerase sigma-70 factor (ECF subfamily)
VKIRSLVHDARNGDREAFGKLYDNFLDAVYRFVYFRVGTREVAEDITETAFVSIFENIGGYNERGLPFEAWVYRITRNKIIDYYRSKKKTISLAESADVSDDKQNPERETERQLTKEYIMDCIRVLPESYQEIIILKYIEDKTNEEISELLDKPLAHVRVLQSRAVQKLRTIVDHE